MLPDELTEYVADILEEVEFIAGGDRAFIVMRGLPGSGKSTVSKEVQRIMQLTNNKQVVRVSTDEILETCEGGYFWEGRKMPFYHGIAEKILNAAFKARVPAVILDNTNIKHKDYNAKVMSARQHGYIVVECIIGGFGEEAIQLAMDRNTHNVPEFAIRKMAENFQA